MGDEEQGRFKRTPMRMQTPYGILYPPRGHWVQGGLLLLAFVGNFAAAKLCGSLLGGISSKAQEALYIPFFIIMFVGYALWVTYLKALAFDLIAKSLWRVVFNWLLHRKKPSSPHEIMPSKEKLVEAAVRAQKGARGFIIVSLPIAFISALLATTIESQRNFIVEFWIVSFCCVGWGLVLSILGRRGFLPLPEEST
ncbi:MAG: hypothetical protein IPJ88_04080 [Myxococcales bacterium]|nr:MAG: hypothetical protein IPJ88_04080 [Myxococcales bacterium]